MSGDAPHSRPHQFLAFHKLAEQFPFESTVYPVQRFARLLYRLTDNGFRLFNSGEDDLSGNGGEVVITFDDGYAHLGDLLPPLMKRLSFRPIIFMPTLWIVQFNRWDFSHRFRPVRHLSACQIKTLSDSGVIFGSHGHSHNDLRAMPDNYLAAELARSRDILINLTEQPISTISYPFGRHNRRLQSAAGKTGYKQGFTMSFPEDSDQPLATGRFAIYNWDSIASVSRKLNRGPFYWYEKCKANLVNFASGGTILLSRFRNSD